MQAHTTLHANTDPHTLFHTHTLLHTTQSIKTTLGLAPSGRSSPLYEALTKAEIKSERSAKKTAEVIDRILEVCVIGRLGVCVIECVCVCDWV